MKLNYETCLVGEKVILVPYRPEHVPRYHEWMKDPALLEATGSEPLSFDEEVKMQQTWKEDEKKCTFIIHMTDRCSDFEKESKQCAESEEALFRVNENLDWMVGDANLFLSEMDEDEDEGSDDDNGIDAATQQPASPPTEPRIQAEIDIMIAEKDCRGKGLGRAATCAMALYGITELNIQRIFCKINEDNAASLNLFKSIGFEQCDYAACFKQVELELRKSTEEMQEIFKVHGGSFKKVPCPLTKSIDES